MAQPLENTIVQTVFTRTFDALTSHNAELRQNVKDLMEQAKKPPEKETVTVHPRDDVKPKSALETMKEELTLLNDVIGFAADHGMALRPGASGGTGSSGADQLALMKHERDMLEMKFNHEEAMHKISREEVARDNALHVELAKVTGRRKLVQDIRGAVIDGATAIGAEAAGQLKKSKGAGSGSMQECPACHQKSIYVPKGATGNFNCTNHACRAEVNVEGSE